MADWLRQKTSKDKKYTSNVNNVTIYNCNLLSIGYEHHNIDCMYAELLKHAGQCLNL